MKFLGAYKKEQFHEIGQMKKKTKVAVVHLVTVYYLLYKVI